MLSHNLGNIRLKHLFFVMATFAVAFGFFTNNAIIGYPLVIAITLFWFGMLTMYVSDKLDGRPIDQRGIANQITNGISATLVAVSSVYICFSFVVGVIAIIRMMGSAF